MLYSKVGWREVGGGASEVLRAEEGHVFSTKGNVSSVRVVPSARGKELGQRDEGEGWVERSGHCQLEDL